MILCCGEALIDMLPCDLAPGGRGFAPHSGGSVFNTAIALGRLGTQTGFVSGISTDMFGEQLTASLTASNVDTSLCVRSNRPTTLAFVKLTGGEAEYAFFDENSAGRMFSEGDLPDLDPAVAALHFGAISLITEPCGSAYEALMRREHASRVISLDPNIRPGFIADRQAHLARMQRMIAMSDIVKLSDADLAWFDENRSFGDQARDWLGQGAKLIVLTRGAKGATGMTQDCIVDIPAMPVDIVDSVGAGDTFNAGLLSALERGGYLTKDRLGLLNDKTLAEILSFAAKAAAITVSRAGADPPWAHEVNGCGTRMSGSDAESR